jgi:hypothetical protein
MLATNGLKMRHFSRAVVLTLLSFGSVFSGGCSRNVNKSKQSATVAEIKKATVKQLSKISVDITKVPLVFANPVDGETLNLSDFIPLGEVLYRNPQLQDKDIGEVFNMLLQRHGIRIVLIDKPNSDTKAIDLSSFIPNRYSEDRQYRSAVSFYNDSRNSKYHSIGSSGESQTYAAFQSENSYPAWQLLERAGEARSTQDFNRPLSDVPIIFIQNRILRGELRRVIAHEMIHYLLHQRRNKDYPAKSENLGNYSIPKITYASMIEALGEKAHKAVIKQFAGGEILADLNQQELEIKGFDSWGAVGRALMANFYVGGRGEELSANLVLLEVAGLVGMPEADKGRFLSNTIALVTTISGAEQRMFQQIAGKIRDVGIRNNNDVDYRKEYKALVAQMKIAGCKAADGWFCFW